MQVHSPAELKGELLRADDNIVVLMCKATSCRPCKVMTHTSAQLKFASVDDCCKWPAAVPAGLGRNTCTLWSTIQLCWHAQTKMQRLKTSAHLQMFSRKYQRIAADYAAKGALFLEILGDETSETRVSPPDRCSNLPARGIDFGAL